MKFILFLVYFFSVVEFSRASVICDDVKKNCPIYVQIKSDEGVRSRFEIFSYGKIAASYEMYGYETFDIVKKNSGYSLISGNSNPANTNNEVFIFGLTDVCDGCMPKIKSERHMSTNRSYDYNGEPKVGALYLVQQGAEKEFKKTYFMNDDFEADQEMPSLGVYNKIKKMDESENFFYINRYSSANEYLGDKILYSPPLKKYEIDYFHMGCIQGCGFTDKLLQSENNRYELFGEIDNTIPIKMELIKAGSKISGRYCYLRNCKEYLSLSGSVEKNGIMLIDEYSKAKKTGSMRLILKGDNFLFGDWVSKSGKKMSILLVRAEN